MINVVYDEACGITMTGHAGQAPRGQDIVCAGASAIVISLAEMLERNSEELIERGILLESGRASIKVVPRGAFKNCCEGAFEMAMCGLELLSEQYPDYICVSRVAGNGE
ncbi:MAG: ribosomal-processing cysteine protease Prp [Clostridia bacterium]|nr:ribosomal-processing cysteine protease Prp [Clostridia bacterium]MBQ8836486.1 ribosomal-processing cysteine protease Prp [Clostridia bacterium]